MRGFVGVGGTLDGSQKLRASDGRVRPRLVAVLSDFVGHGSFGPLWMWGPAPNHPRPPRAAREAVEGGLYSRRCSGIRRVWPVSDAP